MKTWNQFLVEQNEFSSTQINLPDALANDIKKWGKTFIPDDDLYTENGHGREEEIHVTVLYGLHSDDSKEARDALKDESSMEIELKETSIFEADKFDVVKFTVQSKDLVGANKKLSTCDHTNDHGSYSPHCTIAYVKKGTGKKYTGNKKFDGVKFTSDTVLFSTPNRNKTKIALH
jgi:2'-5' RNA ligase